MATNSGNRYQPETRDNATEELRVRGRPFVAGNETERFWSKVDKTTGDCWTWTSVINADGYGHFRAKVAGDWRYLKAHRYAYEQLVEPIEDGMTLDHLCRNRACVRPDHLEPVTHAENVRRGHQRKGARTANVTGDRFPGGKPATVCRPDGATPRDLTSRTAGDSYAEAVAEAHRVITAAEMDEMTPDQRAALVDERSHTSLDELTDDFRTRVIQTAQRLADQLDNQLG